jgi:hypothetical protein
MTIDARERRNEPEADLATLYGGFHDAVAYPLLVEPRDDEPGPVAELDEAELHEQILIGLLRLAP